MKAAEGGGGGKVNVSHAGSSLGLGNAQGQWKSLQGVETRALTVAEKQVPFKEVVVVITSSGKNPFM